MKILLDEKIQMEAAKSNPSTGGHGFRNLG